MLYYGFVKSLYLFRAKLYMKEKINVFREKYRANPGWYWLLWTLFLFPLLPEYISPFILFSGFIVFKRQWSKLNNNALLGDMGKAIFILTCYMVISGIWSKTHILSSLIGMLWMGCFLIYVFIANIVNTKEKLKTAITCMNLASGIIGIIAVLEILTYYLSLREGNETLRFPNPLYFDFNKLIFEKIPVDIVYYRFAARASATFDNPLILATFLVITNPFCAFGSLFFTHSRNRKLSRACWLFSTAGIIATTSRGAYIAVGLTLLIVLVSLTKNKKLLRKVLPFVLLVAISTPIGLVIRYKNSSTDFLSSTENRFDIWRFCFKEFIRSPKNLLIGLGAGSDNVHTLLRDGHGLDRTHAHNLFLEMLVEGGLIYFVIVLVAFVFLVKKLYALSKNRNKLYMQYTVLYIASLTGFLMISLFEFTLQSPKELIVFFALLGFIEATYRIAENHIQKTPDMEEREERVKITK